MTTTAETTDSNPLTALGEALETAAESFGSASSSAANFVLLSEKISMAPTMRPSSSVTGVTRTATGTR